MKRCYLLLAITLLLLTSATAQELGELWFPGYVTLKNGQQLTGELSYYSDDKTAVLQLRAEEKTILYNAHQVVYFQFIDDLLQIHRRFYALPYIANNSRQKLMLFFEVLQEGSHLSVLNRVAFRTEGYKANNLHYGRKPDWEHTPAHIGNDQNYKTTIVPYETLYLVTPSSPVRMYNSPTSLAEQNPKLKQADEALLWDMLEDRRLEMQKYIEQNGLDVRHREDLLRIVQYYNDIKEQQQ